MDQDVNTPASSTGTVDTPAQSPVPTETPADPVKAAIQRGDHAEMNRLMNERKMERQGFRPKPQTSKPTPSVAESAPAAPVTTPDAGTGQPSREPQTSDKREPEPGSKEFNFRELVTDRDRWRTEAQDASKRIQALERRSAETARPEPAKPSATAFNVPRPSLDSYDSFTDWQKADGDWLTQRDVHREREIHSHARQSLTQEQEHQRIVGIATAIRQKVDALATTEGFEDLPQLYAESQSPYTDGMLKFYAEDEHGARVMHHMIHNPGQAQDCCMLPVKLQKARLVEIRDSLVKPKSGTPIKQTTDAPNPVRRAVTGRSEAPSDPLKAAREEGQKTGNWTKFNALMNERKRQRMETA